MPKSAKEDSSDNPSIVVNYVINAPKKQVYSSFLKHIWEQNKPFPIGVSSLGSTSDNIGSSYKYNQRKLLLSMITETMVKLKPNNYISYKVESILFPTNNYISNIKFTNYKGNNNVTLITWSAEWECGCSPACCSPGIMAFSRALESTYVLFLKTLDGIIEKKS